jgi:hypothetical protein
MVTTFSGLVGLWQDYQILQVHVASPVCPANFTTSFKHCQVGMYDLYTNYDSVVMYDLYTNYDPVVMHRRIQEFLKRGGGPALDFFR